MPKGEPRKCAETARLDATEAQPHGLTVKTLTKYLDHLAVTGLLHKSAEDAGISPSAIRWRRSRDPEFEAAVRDALEAYNDLLRAEAHRRAVEGWAERPIVDRDGVIIGEVRRYSDRLLELKLKRNDPTYRESIDVNATQNIAQVATSLPMQDLAQLDRAGREALRVVMEQLQPAEAVPQIAETTEEV